MTIPYPDLSRTWDLGTVADGRFFETEFQQLYDNDNDLDGRVEALEARAAWDTAPTSVTPPFTGFGTVSDVNCRTWRVGALLFFEYSFVSGIATSTEARMGLRYNPGSGEVDVATVSTYPTVQPVGGGGSDSQVDRYYTALAEASVTYLTIGMFDASNSALTKRQGSSVAASGWRVSLSGSVRINGW